MIVSRQQQREIALIVITHRSIFQTVAKQKGLNYGEQSALIWMSPVDLEAMGAKDDAIIRLENPVSSIVVKAKSDADCQEGFARMLVSLYSNRLVEYRPSVAKLPNFKRIEVVAKPTAEPVTLLSDLEGD